MTSNHQFITWTASQLVIHMPSNEHFNLLVVDIKRPFSPRSSTFNDFEKLHKTHRHPQLNEKLFICDCVITITHHIIQINNITCVMGLCSCEFQKLWITLTLSWQAMEQSCRSVIVPCGSSSSCAVVSGHLQEIRTVTLLLILSTIRKPQRQFFTNN